MEMEEIKAHVAGCPTCSAANKRVNDFCDAGRLMFFEWAQKNHPRRVELVELTDEEYERLVVDTRRRGRQSERN